MVWSDYPDLYELAGDKQPEWWDEEGVPRFQAFSPQLLNNIYAKQAALLQIACQSCQRLFLVAISWDSLKEAFLKTPAPNITLREKKGLWYGDPPFHIDKTCCAGYSMSSDTKRIAEFWMREKGDWVRQPDLEIPVEDEDPE